MKIVCLHTHTKTTQPQHKQIKPVPFFVVGGTINENVLLTEFERLFDIMTLLVVVVNCILGAEGCKVTQVSKVLLS